MEQTQDLAPGAPVDAGANGTDHRVDNGGSGAGGGTSRRLAAVCRVCAVGCGTLVDVEGDVVRKVSGDPDDPWSRGYTCDKGRLAAEFHHDPDRLDVPQVRRGGQLVTVGWDEALDDIAARTAAILAESGPGAIAHYTGTGGPLDPSGYAMAHGFFRALGTDQAYSALSVDCTSKFLVPELVAGVQLPFQPDIDEAQLLIAIGVNTVVSHGHGLMMANPLGRIRALRARGGRFVVVDPRTSESARHADLHVALRPGADPALLAFLVGHVLASGADTAELERCADADSVERLRRLVAPWDADRAAAVCDVEVGVLRQLAEYVTAAGRVAMETGTGVSMSRSANLTEWLVWALSAVTGSLDRPGGATFNPGFLRPMEDALPAGRGDLLPRPPSRPDVPRIVNGEMPCAVLADEITSGAIRALFVRVGNPAMAIPGTAALAEALSGLELLVAIDARSTATTALATHVLPMTDHLERADLVTGYLQATPFMRYAPAIVARRAERRPQWWVFAELSRRLGLPRFGSSRADALVAEAEAAGHELDDELVAATLARSARRPWAEVREAPYGVLDDSLPPGWLIPDRLPRPLDLAPALLAEVFEAPWPARLGGPGPGPGPGTTGLVLVNRRSGGQYNSFSPRRAAAGPARPTLFVHPADAARHGLIDGDRAELSTAAGSLVAVVEVTDRTRIGVVSLPHAHALANVNALTSTHDVDPLNGMPILSGLAVTLSGPCSN